MGNLNIQITCWLLNCFCGCESKEHNRKCSREVKDLSRDFTVPGGRKTEIGIQMLPSKKGLVNSLGPSLESTSSHA